MTSVRNVLPCATAAVLLGSFQPAQSYAQEDEQGQSATREWVDTIDWDGDLRLRYEGIDEDGEAGRDRFRFRGRFGFDSELSKKVQFSARLATSVQSTMDFCEFAPAHST